MGNHIINLIKLLDIYCFCQRGRYSINFPFFKTENVVGYDIILHHLCDFQKYIVYKEVCKINRYYPTSPHCMTSQPPISLSM